MHKVGQSLQQWLGWNKQPKVPETGEAKSLYMAHVKASDTMTSDLTISPTSFSFTHSTHTDFDISKHRLASALGHLS